MSTPDGILTAEEARVVGALAEKHLTTPQYYPLTHNALVNACNQSNNRDPVVNYEAATVDGALATLREKGYARVVHPGGGSRVMKYRQVIDEALGLDRKELSLICVLLLRGPQTLNELRTRTERMAEFDDESDVEHDLDRLAARDPALVVRLGRQPGQREERFTTTLAEFSATPAASSAAPTSAPQRPHLPSSPRLQPIAIEDASEEQRDLLGAVGIDADNLFRTLVRHPNLMRRWLTFGGALLLAGKLAPRLREIAILRTAHLVGAAYEWGQHIEMAMSAGLTHDEIDRVARGADDGWTALEALVVRACDDVHHDGVISDAVWSGLADELDDTQLIELPMLIGHYRMLAAVIASLGVQAEPGLPPLPPT